MRYSIAATLAGLLVLAGLAASSRTQAQVPGVVVQLELAQEFYYEGDPLDLQISIQNLADEKKSNPIRTPLLGGFRVRPVGGELLTAEGKTAAQEPERPADLSPGSFYGLLLDITEMYPQLQKQGVYQIHWGGGGLVSQMVVVTILPRYDPTMTYDAQVETGMGEFTIRLFGEQSPIAVKSFIDMARVGVYDGLQIHEVHPDSFIVGGDPMYSERPRRAITFPAEFGPVPLVAGTVVMKPASAAPPANGSAFMITLKPQSEWVGQVTVLGQVTKGLDVIRRMSQVPSSRQTSKPFFKPVEPIVIDKVTITGARPGGAPGAVVTPH